MNKVIVTTTINLVTPAIEKFAAMDGWQMVIAGDKKTPDLSDVLNSSNCYYLTPSVQEALDPKLSELIGWNCIQRRNFAFLFACKELKADVIYTTDDDNIPNEDWGKRLVVGERVECDDYEIDSPAFDPLSVTNHPNLWHRGYPLELVRHRKNKIMSMGRVIAECDVQADLWNGEADVDAICRLTHETDKCYFDSHTRPYTSYRPSPFNSQNTFLTKEVMPHYFMFPGIGRMDDVAASYHVQAQGFRVMYGWPTVTQKRNEHDLIKDLLAEVWGIQNNLAIVKEIPTNKNAVLDRLPPQSLAAFRQYQRHFE